MRYALISDIHANLPALEAVLRDIDTRQVDAIHHLGDLVGYAPWPNEVAALLRERGITGISGNYDSTVASRYKHCGCRYEDPAQEALSHLSYAWTLDHVGDDTRRLLAALPFRMDLRPQGGHQAGPRVTLIHGNAVLNTFYWTEDRSDDFCLKMAETLAATAGDVICFGHTHKPWTRVVAGMRFLNTGSVGRPKDGDWRAGYAVLEIGAEPIVEFIRVEYDVERTAAAIRASDLPDEFADQAPHGRPRRTGTRHATEELMSEPALRMRRAIAEGLGTYFLVLVGPGAAMVDAFTGGAIGHAGVALAFAFVVVAMVYALGHLSGAHINPAVTIAFWSVRRFRGAEVLPYVLAQCAGAIGASLTMRAILGPVGNVGATLPAISASGAFAIEFLLSFVLMLVIMAVATDERVAGGFAGIAVGLTVGFDAMMGGPLTGASMNPARSLGPAVAGGGWDSHWIYWLAPILGMAAAARAYEFLRVAEPLAVVPTGIPIGVQGPIDPGSSAAADTIPVDLG